MKDDHAPSPLREEKSGDPAEPGQLQPEAAEGERWEGTVDVDDDVFFRVLRETATVLRRSGLPHLFMGGLASAALGRQRWTHDIDLFVTPADAGPALDALAGAGFQTQQTDPGWLFKALKDEVLVDVIFLSVGQVFLDDEMVRRARSLSVEDIRLPVMAAEDLIVIKALVHKERSPWHWFDALALLRRGDLDWDYVLRRARQYGPLRVLSLLYYARSNDQTIPDEVLRRLREVA